ncbi:reverse transcriptase domain-containing protein [Zobellia uliginosa]|uniref:reverse transcriptase domain-containing protein n=1 Tax=Zobellia uliginosa TaxID=143224 RepID=UPI001C07D74F|nr:reverse transcriptase domain-containing protein [Zobellia uliginosa]MBU2947376.1 RNA-directed DNA polymerase (Reverse transcriptase) [Zobellia uliginosa]
MHNIPSTKKDWFKDRGYLHLTNRISKRDKEKVFNYISNPDKVKKHKFSPFILKQTDTRRYKYSQDLNRKSHKAVDDKGQITSNSKVRPIMYATHIDSHIYSYYSHKIIQLKYEKYLEIDSELNSSVTAYRQIISDDKVRFKYNVDFAKEVFDEIKDRKDCSVLAFDIENFFPSLNHSQLKNIWCHILGTKSLPRDHYTVFKSITNFSYFFYDDLRERRKGNLNEKNISNLKNIGKFQFFGNYQDFKETGIQVYKNQKKREGMISGIPQGLPISAMLANLYMLPFDKNIVNKLVRLRNCYYRRYSDDLVLICHNDDLDLAEKIVRDEISKIKLTISKAKTEKFNFKTVNNRLECFKIKNEQIIPNSYLQYLGFDFYGHKTLIKSANVSRFYREMKESIAMKAKRVKAVQEKQLTEDAIIFKRKIYRLYSFKGIKSRKTPAIKITFEEGKLIKKNYSRKYRGNFVKYAYRASDIMEAPEIKRQLRRHMLILKKYSTNFNFDNSPKI